MSKQSSKRKAESTEASSSSSSSSAAADHSDKKHKTDAKEHGSAAAAVAAIAKGFQSELGAALSKLLSGVTVEKVLKAKHTGVLVLKHSQNVASAMQALAKERVLSAPVHVQNSIEDSEGGSYLGMLDVSSIAHYFVRDSPDESASLKQHKAFRASFFDRKLVSMTGEDVRLIHTSEAKSEQLLDCVRREFFKADRSPVHRVAVFDAKGATKHILSQSDIVRHMHVHVSSLPERLQRATIESLDLGQSPVATVSSSHTALEALQLLEQKKLGGLGVVDATGALLANFSASDLRGLVPDEIALLDLPVVKFLQCEQAPVLTYRWRPVSAITCHLDATFKDLLSLFVNSRIHRVYVVDHNTKPLRVITLTDLIRLAL